MRAFTSCRVTRSRASISRMTSLLDELRCLSDRQLADIGINRSEIDSVALGATHRSAR